MNKREAILEATLQLVLQEGFYHLNMKKVSTAAGVAAGTIYVYFVSKEELINDLYRHVMQLYLAAVMAEAASEADMTGKLTAMLRNYLHFFLQRPDCYSFLQQYRFSPFIFKETEKNGALLAPIYQLIEDARTQGILKDLPLPVLLALGLGPIYELVRMGQAAEIDMQDAATQQQCLLACWESIRNPAFVASE